ncbi:DUF21 and CBS domain protein [Phlyctema vagabunda]|uniref:DUF21 and CBS domain protein n=1 Tax=Phlyctema vagabunda TaxID=108571 RepID=A0ABR4PA63_9HELO
MAPAHLIDGTEPSNFFAFLGLSIIVLGLCALLAGLTLAICSLDVTWLEITSRTARSKRRTQARAILDIRRHHNWMLCSLIICSVACGEAFPIIMREMLIHKSPWLIVLISTLLIAMAGEIIPQTMIPRKALAWAYHFRPVIWFCMALTSLLSYPISWLINTLGGKFEEHAIFSNPALAILISLHTKNGGRGGQLKESTARVMIGALELDHCRIGGDFTRIPHADADLALAIDIEKAQSLTTQAIYTRWSSVCMVDINERVDSAFMKKIKSWNYSRIPVLGDWQLASEDTNVSSSSLAHENIFGFLHIKNLVGIKFQDTDEARPRLLVKDLSIYPLPIVRDDMEVMKLLSLFQLGMARMAIVVHAKENHAFEKYWESDFLEAALRNTEPLPQRDRIFGIRSPLPIGVITYEDIVSRLLQKRSCDEKDFFNRGVNNMLPLKLQATTASIHLSSSDLENADTPAIGTCKNEEISHSVSHQYRFQHRKHKEQTDFYKDKRKPAPNDATQCQSPGAKAEHARYPFFSEHGDILSEQDHPPYTDPGREERELGGLDGTREGVLRTRCEYEHSSYTLNSQGGFHGSNNSGRSTGNHLCLSPEDLEELGEYPAPFPRGRRIFPVIRSMASINSKHVSTATTKTPCRSTSVMLPPKNTRCQLIAPLSQPDRSTSGMQNVNRETKFDLRLPFASMSIRDLTIEIPPPRYTPENHSYGLNSSVRRHNPRREDSKNSGETLSVASWDFSDFEDGSTHLGDNGIPTSRSSFELPTRMNGPGNAPQCKPQELPRRHVSTSGNSGSGIPQREKSFHDDRALLPSQRKRLPHSAEMSAARRSSLWF